jgi:hypothetical protein
VQVEKYFMERISKMPPKKLDINSAGLSGEEVLRIFTVQDVNMQIEKTELKRQKRSPEKFDVLDLFDAVGRSRNI